MNSKPRSKTLKISNLMEALDRSFPAATAMSSDNVGLLVGNSKTTIRGAVVAIDLDAAAFELARQKGFNLIVTHHPAIFPKQKGLSKICSPHPIYECLNQKIAVAACHTNFDACSMEALFAQSESLGVNPMGRLFESSDFGVGNAQAPLFFKLVIFAPTDAIDRVREAVFAAGAGQIAAYDQCGFESQGFGTFRGGADTHPTVGQPGRRERVSEIKWETVVPSGLLNAVLGALKQAHPYEEPAFDVIPALQPVPKNGVVRGLGIGFWGEIKKTPAISVETFRKRVKAAFGISTLWATEPMDRTLSNIKRVAFSPGKGASFVRSAAEAGCDVFVTGETGYHAALEGARRGMAVWEIGHRESERFFLRVMKAWLSKQGVNAVSIERPVQRNY